MDIGPHKSIRAWVCSRSGPSWTSVACRFFRICGTARHRQGPFQTRHHAGTVQSYVRPLSAAWIAGLDEVRDARGLSHLRAVSAVRKTACLASGFRPRGIIVCSCTSPLTAILRRSASLDQLRVHALATPVAASIFRYVPPFVRSAQMIRAILLASATATTL